MLATFHDPSAPCFHGALDVSPYAQYTFTTITNPNVCGATKYAEDIYGLGYLMAKKNCADFTYQVLESYGVHFLTGPGSGKEP